MLSLCRSVYVCIAAGTYRFERGRGDDTTVAEKSLTGEDQRRCAETAAAAAAKAGCTSLWATA